MAVKAISALALAFAAASAVVLADERAVTPFDKGVSSFDYKRAWPIKASVLTPDPVVGDQEYWEHWVYSSAFANRFQGLNPANQPSDLGDGVYAFVFRTYKRQILQWPALFQCDYDIYFDSKIAIPLSERDRPDYKPSKG